MLVLEHYKIGNYYTATGWGGTSAPELNGWMWNFFITAGGAAPSGSHQPIHPATTTTTG